MTGKLFCFQCLVSELALDLKEIVQGREVGSEIEQAVRGTLTSFNSNRRSDTSTPQSDHGQKMERVNQKLSDCIRRTDQILALLFQVLIETELYSIA